MRNLHRLCEVYPGICLTTEEKAWKNLSQGRYINVTFRIHRLCCYFFIDFGKWQRYCIWRSQFSILVLPDTSHNYLFNTIRLGKGTLHGPVGLQEVEAFGVFRRSARECCKVVSPTYRPPLPTRDILSLSRPQGQGWSQLNIPIAVSGFEPATFPLVAQCLNQLHHCVYPYN